jgi:hypothetical protein
MEVLNIKGTDATPNVIFDKEKEVFEISGKSLPEDVTTFYDPILNWIDEYAKNPNPKTNFVIKMSYFNTASSKILLDILMILEELHQNGNEILIRWFYPEDDEDMMEAGEEYADIVELPFEQVSYRM